VQALKGQQDQIERVFQDLKRKMQAEFSGARIYCLLEFVRCVIWCAIRCACLHRLRAVASAAIGARRSEDVCDQTRAPGHTRLTTRDQTSA